MRPDQINFKVSRVGVALFDFDAPLPASAVSALTGSPAGLIAGLLARSLPVVCDPGGGSVGEGGGAAPRQVHRAARAGDVPHDPDRGYDQPLRGPAGASGERVSAESTLTRDTVPVNVDAIVFWMVWNAEKSILEVQDFTRRSAQRADGAARIDRAARTAPDGGGARDARQGAAAHSGREDHAVGNHGAIGGDPRRADSARRCRTRCRARRRRNASGGRASILGTAETEIAEKFSQAALTYQDNPVALHLRAMNMLYEAIKEKGSMVIVPSSAVETMGLGGMLATASVGGARVVE